MTFTFIHSISTIMPVMFQALLCYLDTLCQGSLFVSLVESFSCVPVVKCMAPVDGTLLSRGYLLGRFSLPITFSRIQKFDSTSSVNTGNFKKDVPDNHVHITLAFQLLDIDQIFRFHI